MKKILYHIREFFWPLLDNLTEDEKKKLAEPVMIPDIAVSEENLDSTYNLTVSIIKEEDDRRKGIESKAALLLSTISIASSIIVTASAYIANAEAPTIGARISICVSALVAIYAARTVWFSVRALERGTYHGISIEDINVSGTKNQHTKHLIKEYWTAVYKNRPVINRKVDFLMLAQEYYKIAVIVIFVYSIVILTTSILPGSFLGKKKGDITPNKTDTCCVSRVIVVDTIKYLNIPTPDSTAVK